jgi:hypothetical protein
MFVQSTKYLQFHAIQIWWPECVRDVISYLERAPVLILWQCPEPLAQDFSRWTFRYFPFTTPLIDLTHTEEELWQKLEPKSCRYELRKAQKMECALSCNEEIEAGLLLINDSIRRLRYRAELSERQWRELLPNHDIFVCKWRGAAVAVHVLLRDPPGRARLLLSGGVDRSDPRFRGIVSPSNRLLHWHELQHYKAKGFRIYDFGGVDLRKNSSEPNPNFKLSFGGEVVVEPILYMAKNPVLRAVLSGSSAAHTALRKFLWTDAWRSRVRKISTLKSVFR